MTLDPWFLENLVCPRHRGPLRPEGTQLTCSEGDRYDTVDGIPVMLLGDVEQTHEAAIRSLSRGDAESVGGVDGKATAAGAPPLGEPPGVHPFVQRNLIATHGLMYESMRLTEYPIPEIPLPRATGSEAMLDVGCNWGRWSTAGALKGYRVVGIDPSLEAILAARSIARQLGKETRFVVGDARFLPFRAHCFDLVFSYSVLQHFSKDNVREALGSIRRVLKDDGVSLIQMLNGVGARSIYNRAKMVFAERHPFDVRFWSVRELRDIFSAALGPTTLVVDGFFSANVQRADFHLLPGRFRALVDVSDLLRRLTSRFPLLANVADSLYVLSGDNPARVAEIQRVLVAR